jgi:hypothetical protein
MEDMRLLTTDQQNSEKEIKGENHEKFEMQEKKKEEKKREGEFHDQADAKWIVRPFGGWPASRAYNYKGRAWRGRVKL